MTGGDDTLIRVLNQYRGAEIKGANVILHLGKLADSTDLRANFSKHLRDEAVHAWTWTRAIGLLGGDVVDVEDPYQMRLGAAFGLPRSITELLALTLVSERRGVATYVEHLEMPGVPDVVTRALRAILKDERWHVSWIGEELERRAAVDDTVEAVISRAEVADLVAAADLREEMLGTRSALLPTTAPGEAR